MSTVSVMLRKANKSDAELLLNWRNDPISRRSSHNPRLIDRDAHLRWFSSILNDSSRMLFIAERGGSPVGSVRAEMSEGTYILSWLVCPSSRGQGVAKTMVSLLCAEISGPVRAEIKKDNIPSIRVAEKAGLVFEKEIAGVLYYSRY